MHADLMGSAMAVIHKMTVDEFIEKFDVSEEQQEELRVFWKSVSEQLTAIDFENHPEWHLAIPFD